LPGIVVSGESTSWTSGYFEVAVKGGPVVHSKKDGGGFVTEQNMPDVVAAITKFAQSQ